MVPITWGAIDDLRTIDGEWYVMQFTGLLDKNGAEIYDGDLLDFDAVEWGSHEFTPEAIWLKDMIGEWPYCGVVSDVPKFRKVIGNIYENPELLK